MKNACFFAVSLLVLGLLGAGCSEKKKGTDIGMEVAAQRLGVRAEQLEMQERPAEASKIYIELREKFGNTKYYAELHDKMEKRGISLEAPMVSHTSKRLFKLQNLILSYKASKGEYPKGHAINIPKDLWGNPLVYRITSEKEKKKPYEFLVMSIGPDQKDNTDDDIYVIYAGNRSPSHKLKKEKAAEAEEAPSGRISSLTARGSTGQEPGGRSLTLEELSKMETGKAGTSGSVGGEKKFSIDELQKLGAKKRNRGRSANGEKVISLKELLSSQE